MCANRSYVKETIAATVHNNKQRWACERHVERNGWLHRKLLTIQLGTRPLTDELRRALHAEGQPSWAQPLWSTVRGGAKGQQQTDCRNWSSLRANQNSQYGRLCVGALADDATIVRTRFPFARRRLIG